MAGGSSGERGRESRPGSSTVRAVGMGPAQQGQQVQTQCGRVSGQGHGHGPGMAETADIGPGPGPAWCSGEQ